jgi:hypothetical protein
MRYEGNALLDGKRPGFFLGDGAGVGKGRQIAALCLQHKREGGRRTLWVSVSSDLRIDAERDLNDIDAGIGVYPKASTGQGLLGRRVFRARVNGINAGIAAQGGAASTTRVCCMYVT